MVLKLNTIAGRKLNENSESKISCLEGSKCVQELKVCKFVWYYFI